MAIEAERVVVVLEAQTAAASAAVKNFDKSFEGSMSSVERSATQVEAVVRNSVSRLGNQVRDTSGQIKFATRDLGFQISDIGVQLAGGSSPFLILAQQGPQTAQAIQLITEAGASLSVVMKSLALPAILAIVSAIYGLASSHDKAKGATDGHGKAVKSLTDALADLVKETDASIAVGQREIYVQAARATATLAEVTATRELIKAKIQSRIEDVEAQKVRSQAPGQRGELGTLALNESERKLQQLETKLAAQDGKVKDAERAVRTSGGKIAAQIVTEQFDAAAHASGHYERQVDRLNDALKRGTITVDQYRAGLSRVTAERDKALESAKSHTTATHGSGTAAVKAAENFDNFAEALRQTKVDAADLTKTLNDLREVDSRQLDEIMGRDWRDGYKEATSGNPLGDQSKAEAQASDDAKRHAEENVRDLADLYYDLFDGGTDRVWDNFKRQGLAAIAEIAARWTAANLLNSGGEKDIVKIGASVLSSFGRASGGYVGPNSLHRVNEGSGGVELLRMGPQGGEVIPLGQTSATVPQGGTTIVQNISVDARNSVTPPGFARAILAQANGYAREVGGAAYSKALADAPGALAKRQRNGI